MEVMGKRSPASLGLYLDHLAELVRTHSSLLRACTDPMTPKGSVLELYEVSLRHLEQALRLTMTEVANARESLIEERAKW